MKVRVNELGGIFEEVELDEGSTVKRALEAAGARTDVQKQIKVNLNEADLTTILNDGDTVYVVPNIKGNRK